MSVLSSQRRNTGKINPGVGAERGEAATVMSGGETGLCLDYSEEGAGFICRVTLATISLTRHEQRDWEEINHTSHSRLFMLQAP